MKTNIMELRRQRVAVLDGAQAIMNKAAAENRALNEDEEKQVNDAKAQADALTRQEKLAESIDEMRGAVPAQAPMVNRGSLGDNEANAWKAFVRHGDSGGLRHLMQPGEESRGKADIVLSLPREARAVTDSTMNITTAGDGKNLVPTTLVNQIARRKHESMLAARLGCRRVPGVGTTVNFPYRNADPENFALTSEQSDAHGNNYERAAYTTALKAFTLVKLTRKIEFTEEMLEDTGVDLMGFISGEVGDEMARTHNEMLLTEVEANGTSFKSFASNAAIAAGELEAILGNDTLGFYLEDTANAHWVMRSSTHWAINAVTSDARFYAQQLTGLLGYDVMHSNKVDAIGAGGKSVMFGDWSYVGYREAPELRFIQDIYSVDGLIILKYSFRAVYGVLQAGAIGYGLHP